MAGFGFDLREQHRLEDVVAELLAQRRVIVMVDGLEHFVRLFEHERRQRVDRLLAIPRAAVWRAQAGDDVDETAEFFGGGCEAHRRVIRSAVNLIV